MVNTQQNENGCGSKAGFSAWSREMIGMDSGNRDERNAQHDRYGGYMPLEIPVPDISGRNGKDSTNKILIIAACIGALLFAIAGAGIAYLRSTPAYKISRGFQNLAKEISQSQDPLAEKAGIEELVRMISGEGFHTDTRINLTSEFLPASVNTIGIDTDCSRDVQDQEMRADMSFSVMNYDFAHLSFYTDNEYFCFSVPELFLEDMYFENQNVISQYDRSFLAGLTGPSEMEDFSLDFFPEEELSLQEWKDMNSLMERYASELEACRSGMIMEKAEKGVYRVILPGEETDRLLRHMMDYRESIYPTGTLGQWWKEYDSLIYSDIRIVFEINGKNRIENIRFEEPVRLLDGKVSVSGSLSFLGDARSIDRVVGTIMTESAEKKESDLSFQFLQTPARERYESELYVGVLDDDEILVEMRYTADSDAALNKINRILSVRNAEDNIEIALEGSLDDIVKGESLTLDLEEMTFGFNEKELFKLTGDILIEPPEEEIIRNVEKETAFFSMTEEDWWDIVGRLAKEYGGILGYLWQ